MLIPAEERPEMPLVVEPVSLQRVQAWACAAGSMTTSSGLDLVEWAFSALSWEARAHEYLTEVHDISRIDTGVSYLDLVVSSLARAADQWQCVIEIIGHNPPLSSDHVRMLEKDARERFHLLKGLQQQAVELVSSICAAYHLALPDSTNQYLQSLQGAQ